MRGYSEFLVLRGRSSSSEMLLKEVKTFTCCTTFPSKKDERSRYIVMSVIFRLGFDADASHIRFLSAVMWLD